MRDSIRFARIIIAVLVLASNAVWLGDGKAFAEEEPVVLSVKRGLTAELKFAHRNATLRSPANQSIDAPILVRLERVDSGSVIAVTEHSYVLRFFGAVAGQYNLANWVVQQDGSPLTGDDALPAMNIRVASQLPSDHGTSLYEIDDPSLAMPGGYRALLALIALAWILAPVCWSVMWWRSRVPAEPIPVQRGPTLVDRLEPLVQRASDGQLTIDEQGRMELLLYVFWQKRLGLPESLVDALPALRRHSEAGGLLRKMEAWIHADAHHRQPLNETTMKALLAPYHAMREDELRLQQMDSVGDVA